MTIEELAALTADEKRIKIAEKCGYRFNKESCAPCTHVYGLAGEFIGLVGGPLAGPNPLPDYLNDLNAMHEAEKKLPTFSAMRLYLMLLKQRCNRSDASESCPREIFADARERANAFLLTMFTPTRNTEIGPRHPCAICGMLRTQAEGGATFTVCDDCWDKLRTPLRHNNQLLPQEGR